MNAWNPCMMLFVRELVKSGRLSISPLVSSVYRLSIRSGSRCVYGVSSAVSVSRPW